MSDVQCMGIDCEKPAKVQITGLDPDDAISRTPVPVCMDCLVRGGWGLSIFKWHAADRLARPETVTDR